MLSEIKPSDINASSLFIGSGFRNSESETVARNIVIISRQTVNHWFPFTFEDYKRLSAPKKNFQGEEACLNGLVSQEFLDKNGDSYSVNEKFLIALKMFIKK